MKSTGMLLAVGAFFALPLAFGADNTMHQRQKKKPMIDKVDNNVSGQGYGMAGCGLGSIVFGQKTGFVQVFATTTNGTFGSQTFGITFGTSNCDASSGDSSTASVERFVAANRDALAKDVSRGGGETVSTVSRLMNCSDSSLLGQKLQQNYQRIFTGTTSSEAIGAAIVDTVHNDSQLSQSCQG